MFNQSNSSPATGDRLPATIIDLTHTLAPGMPQWPGDPPIEIETAADYERNGYFMQTLTLVEHTGTHFGSSSHFDADGITVDDVDPSLLIRAAVVIDVRTECATDSDYGLAIERLMHWEHEHGEIPTGSVVLMCTGWDAKWNDAHSYAGIVDGDSRRHTPGFTLEAARFLAEERNVVGLGIDTLGIDRGIDEECSVNAWWLHGSRFHLENLCNLAHVPPRGATLFIGALKIAGGSGSPARVLCIT